MVKNYLASKWIIYEVTTLITYHKQMGTYKQECNYMYFDETRPAHFVSIVTTSLKPGLSKAVLYEMNISSTAAHDVLVIQSTH